MNTESETPAESQARVEQAPDAPDVPELRRLLNFALANAEHVAAGKMEGYPGRTVSFLQDALRVLADIPAERPDAPLRAKFLEGANDILQWAGCSSGDCPHKTQAECEEAALALGKQVAAEFLQDAAPIPTASPAGWWCPTCKKPVPSEHVTYQETHDERAGGCGGAVQVGSEGAPASQGGE